MATETLAQRHATERIVAILETREDLLGRLAPLIYGELLEHEDCYDLCEEICVAAFGQRIACPQCGTMVLPGFLCWGCEEWTAPEETPSTTARGEEVSPRGR